MSDRRREPWADPVAQFSRAANKFHSLRLAWTYPFAAFGRKVSIHRSCHLPRPISKYVSIGDSVIIGRNVLIDVIALPDNDEPVIILEEGCKLMPGVVILAKNRIHVGRNVIFGPSVFLTDHNHAFDDVTRPIVFQGPTAGGTLRIEDGSWIGYGAAVVAGEGPMVIGRNTVVAANSVVTRSVPANSIVTGNPARTAKHFDPSKQAWVMGGAAPAGPQA